MSAFASVKTFFTRILGIGETEAHQLVEAVIADAQPLLTTAEAKAKALLDQAVADLKAAFAALKVDEQALAKAVAAEVARLLGNQPAPAEPPAAS